MKVGGGVGLGVRTHFGKVARARQASQGRVRLSPCARGRTLRTPSSALLQAGFWGTRKQMDKSADGMRHTLPSSLRSSSGAQLPRATAWGCKTLGLTHACVTLTPTHAHIHSHGYTHTCTLTPQAGRIPTSLMGQPRNGAEASGEG